MPRIPWLGLLPIVFWGASFIATIVALEAVHPFTIVATRLSIGAALLLVFARLRGVRILPEREDRPICVLLGVFLATHLLIQAFGLLKTTAINTGWIVGFMPVTIAIGAHFLRQQRVAPIGWAGVTVGTVGVLLVSAIEPRGFVNARWGDFLQLCSCLTWTGYTLIATRALARSGSLRVTTSAMVVAAVICVLATVVYSNLPHLAPPRERSVLDPQVLASLAFLGVFCSGIAFAVWFAANDRYGPTKVAALLYLEPFVTFVLSPLMLGEPVMLNALAGGLLILGGVYLVSQGTGEADGPVITLPADEAGPTVGS